MNRGRDHKNCKEGESWSEPAGERYCKKMEENSSNESKSSNVSMQPLKEENSSVEKENIQDSKKNTNAEEAKEQIDTIKDIASPTTTDDSDASAKSGIENDGDEFKVKKNDDTIEKDKPKIEDDLFDIEDTDDYLLYLEDTLKT